MLRHVRHANIANHERGMQKYFSRTSSVRFSAIFAVNVFYFARILLRFDTSLSHCSDKAKTSFCQKNKTENVKQLYAILVVFSYSAIFQGWTIRK